MGHNAGLITRPINPADIAAVLGVNSYALPYLCMHPNINKRSKFKPYPFGSHDLDITANDAAVLKQHNFCMTPHGIAKRTGTTDIQFYAVPWDQWHAPQPNQGYCPGRIGDFTNYYQYANGGIISARISTNYPHNDRLIMLGGKGKGRIVADIAFSFDLQHDVCPHDFHHPYYTTEAFEDYHFTLLFGPVENGDGFDAAPWVVQSNECIGDMISSAVSTEQLVLSINSDMTYEIKDDTGGNWNWLAVVCLAPPMTVNSAGKFTGTMHSDADSRTGLNFDQMHLISLDMWDDPLKDIQNQSVLFSYAADLKDYITPANLETIVIPAAATAEYLTDPNSGYVPFNCRMYVSAWTYGGEQGLTLSCDNFPDVYFPGNSLIRSLQQIVRFEIYRGTNTSPANLVYKNHDGDRDGLIMSTPSATHSGSSPYYISFYEEDPLDGYEFTLPNLPAGTYTVRMRSRVIQMPEVVADYNFDPPKKQVMGLKEWYISDSDGLVDDTSAVGYVDSKAHDFLITIS